MKASFTFYNQKFTERTYSKRLPLLLHSVNGQSVSERCPTNGWVDAIISIVFRNNIFQELSQRKLSFLNKIPRFFEKKLKLTTSVILQIQWATGGRKGTAWTQLDSWYRRNLLTKSASQILRNNISESSFLNFKTQIDKSSDIKEPLDSKKMKNSR